jgi:hypothetical protein
VRQPDQFKRTVVAKDALSAGPEARTFLSTLAIRFTGAKHTRSASRNVERAYCRRQLLANAAIAASRVAS